MNFINYGIDVLLHLDKYLSVIIQNYGYGTYLFKSCIVLL